MSAAIFLSHSSSDKTFARRLATDLRARGIRIWIDEVEMGVGDSLIGRLEKGIDENDYLAVILSPNSVRSEWVLKEVRMALHREISGKRVVVLPILYKECEIPGFLRDKKYVDFRLNYEYQAGVLEIVRRVALDRFADPEMKKSKAALENLPFTRMWRLALQTGSLSRGLLDFVRDTLAKMTPGEGWNPGIAISYVVFLTEVIEQGPLTKQSWDFFKSLIEDPQLNTGLRYITLDRLLIAAEDLLATGIAELPSFAGNSEPNKVLEQCVINLLDPAAYDDDTTDPSTPIRILSALWRYGDIALRKFLLQHMRLFIDEHSPKHIGLIDPLTKILHNREPISIEEMLLELRSAWFELDDLTDEDASNHRAITILQDLVEEKGTHSADEVHALFREASCAEENGDFRLYLLLTRFISPTYFKTIRERQGEGFAYECLVGLTIDPQIEITLSCLGLIVLVFEFGIEGLVLDHRISGSLITPKNVGQAKNKVCLIDVLCEGLASDDGSDMTNAFTLISIHAALKDAERGSFMSIIRKHALASPRVALLETYYQEGISLKQLEKKLKSHL